VIYKVKVFEVERVSEAEGGLVRNIRDLLLCLSKMSSSFLPSFLLQKKCQCRRRSESTLTVVLPRSIAGVTGNIDCTECQDGGQSRRWELQDTDPDSMLSQLGPGMTDHLTTERRSLLARMITCIDVS